MSKIIIDTNILDEELRTMTYNKRGIYLEQAFNMLLQGTMAVRWASRAPIIDQFNATIADEQKRIKLELNAGTECRACHRLAKLNKKKLSGKMLQGLIILYNRNLKAPREYHKVLSIKDTLIVADLPKLRNWGMIDRPFNTDSKKKTPGTWRITQVGIDFVLGKTQAKEAMYTYNNEVIRWSEEMVYIHEAINNTFDYQEVLETTV
jgi:hypothetical protein